MEREQFTFYASFARAARRIRKPSERCAFYDAVVSFALQGEEPDLDNAPESVALAMELVMPVLASSRRKAENGKRGGSKAEANASNAEANASKAQANASKAQANPKQEERKQTEASSKQSASKKEDKKEGESKKEKENECSISPPTPSSPAPAPKPKTAGAMEMAKAEFSGDLLTAVLDWLSYKRERREPYKEVGLRALFNQIHKAAESHGEAAVVEVIRNSMASGYMGITLDKLLNGAKRSAVTTAANYVPPKASKEQIDFLQKLLDEDRI